MVAPYSRLLSSMLPFVEVNSSSLCLGQRHGNRLVNCPGVGTSLCFSGR